MNWVQEQMCIGYNEGVIVRWTGGREKRPEVKRKHADQLHEDKYGIRAGHTI